LLGVLRGRGELSLNATSETQLLQEWQILGMGPFPDDDENGQNDDNGQQEMK